MLATIVPVEGARYAHFRDVAVVYVCVHRKGSTSECTVNKYGLVPCGHAPRASSHISRILDESSVIYLIEDRSRVVRDIFLLQSLESVKIIIIHDLKCHYFYMIFC